VSVARTLRTARHIPPRQLAERARFVWLRRRYSLDRALPFARAAIDAAGMTPVAPLPRVPDDVLWPEGFDAVERRAAEFARGRFMYLNREADFAGAIRWRDEGASPLWRYQLQYLGCVADLARTGRVADAARILASWRAEFDGRWDAEAWHPYPASLRLVNLCVAAAAAGGFDALGRGVADLAAVHAAYVLRHVEHDVRGNHILENARALVWAGHVFRGGAAGECERTARSILEAEIEEQVFPDGGHFELSPMYHCIVMRDLLEVRALLGDGDSLVEKHVAPALGRMGEFLAGVLCPDGDIPLLGDSVRNFGPPPKTLLALVGASPKAWTGLRSFPDTGLHVFRTDRIWAIFDAGPVCPPYLPAHGQADTLTVEVWIDGVCVVGDPGVHDYTGGQRAWGRSSRAHSTVTIDRADTSEVHGSFRVGGRAKVSGASCAADSVRATMRPFGARAELTREIRLRDGGLEIVDSAVGRAGSTIESRLHLAPGVRIENRCDGAKHAALATPVGRVDVESDSSIFVESGGASREFGRIDGTPILVHSFWYGKPAAWRIVTR
jgi:hypothetical protein